MKSSELMDHVLRAHDISLTIGGPWGHETRLTVTMPDLRSAPRTAGGDWGPHYSVSVPADKPIQATVWAPSGRSVATRDLNLGRLEFECPMLAEVRAATPLVLELPLTELNCRVRVYYGRHGAVLRAECVPVSGVTLGEHPALRAEEDRATPPRMAQSHSNGDGRNHNREIGRRAHHAVD